MTTYENIEKKKASAGKNLQSGCMLSARPFKNQKEFVAKRAEEKLFAMLVAACIMVFAGLISPRLPFTRHTGLRLPWTVRDQDTWNLAHKILGIISLPLALLYVACALTINDFKLVSLLAMLLWIGIPGGISYVFWVKKT